MDRNNDTTATTLRDLRLRDIPPFSSSSSASSAYGRRPPPQTVGSSRVLSASTSTAPRKRPAGDAGLDSRDLLSTTASHAAQRRIIELESKLTNTQNELDAQREESESKTMEILQLRAQKYQLAEGGSKERGAVEAREQAWAEDKTKLQADVTSLRNRANNAENQLEAASIARDKAIGELANLKEHSSNEIALLQSRLQEAEKNVETLKGWKRRAEGLTIELEERKRMAQESRQGERDEEGDKKGNEVLRQEIRRQSQQFVHQQKETNTFKAEVATLRQAKKDAEARERAFKDLERELRDQVGLLMDQLSRSQRDVESLTQTFSSSSTSPSSPTPDIQTLKSRLESISQLHQTATAELAEKEAENKSLFARLNKVSGEAHAATAELMKRLNEAERECRWAKEGRRAAEKNEAMAKMELATRRDTMSRSMPGGGAFEDDAVRVEQLEKIINEYRNELEAGQRDSRETEERIASGAGLVKESLLQAAQDQVDELKSEIDSLQATISELTTANTSLDGEVNDLMRRVASGEYNPATERLIEYANNPAAKIRLVRQKELDDLRAENDALLEELRELEDAKGPLVLGRAGGGDGGDGEGQGEGEGEEELKRYVPRESWERVVKENEVLEAAHAKRLQRLKEIFSSKSKEFLEAVYSLLGWRIKFDESGADIRLTSMYAPKGKMGLTLKFASQEGHFGTMQMTGAMARGLEEARHFWIVERQSVPGFLAQITTECFEKTTIGRAAGYVGLE